MMHTNDGITGARQAVFFEPLRLKTGGQAFPVLVENGMIPWRGYFKQLTSAILAALNAANKMIVDDFNHTHGADALIEASTHFPIPEGDPWRVVELSRDFDSFDSIFRLTMIDSPDAWSTTSRSPEHVAERAAKRFLKPRKALHPFATPMPVIISGHISDFVPRYIQQLDEQLQSLPEDDRSLLLIEREAAQIAHEAFSTRRNRPCPAPPLYTRVK